MQAVIPFLAKWVLPHLSPHMRSPGGGILGSIAMNLMKKSNPPSTREAIRRLELKNSDTFVEIGAGHGESLRTIIRGASNLECVDPKSDKVNNEESRYCDKDSVPKRVVLIEISQEFRKELDNIIQNEIPSGLFQSPIEVYDEDCKSMPYLENDSVDKIFGMNVVYFLDPLEEYLEELKRVLKPGGKIMFGCKFAALPGKGVNKEFINVDKNDIVSAIEKAGFQSSTKKVLVDGGDDMMKNYIEVLAIKPDNSS